ncbi:kinase-like protein [Coniochaeta ligniaria NRRL 30616]|uniref:Kinase-like protein n=1 Tax=Coniochaeta ligniaria NRRL 30616 TaxID=1408157 RepID=A0A1J7IVQ8_9PEZI|nr:kinase-like protein [Coniochaeta ligniaria NRRL 30616]
MAPYVPPPDNAATQHDETEHLAINNTFFRRTWLLFQYKALRRLRLARYDGNCLLLSKRLVVKTGPYVHLTEGATMHFVAANTSIPVPGVYCSFVHKNQAYIVMERLPGLGIPKVWKTLSEAQLDSICEQLRHMLEELRALQPPPGAGVQSCVGGSLRDFRIPHCRPRMGPFKIIHEFHTWLRDGFRPDEDPDSDATEYDVEVREMAAKQDGPWPPPVFTHGDLNASNVLVDGDKVTGIIDWETSGWYPHYWEYTSVWYGNRIRPGWQSMIPKFLQPYPEELKMEITRQKWWGDF